MIITDKHRELYRAGRYVFSPPPVSHARWTEDDWIRYILASDGFIDEDEKPDDHEEGRGYN